MQSSEAKQIDLALWNLLGGGECHTKQMLKIKHKKLVEKTEEDELEWLNRNSKFLTEDLS